MAYTYNPYQKSEKLQNYEQNLEQIKTQKPADYQSQYSQQLQDLQGQIANRKNFTYDVNGDALYQQLKQNYIAQGQQAMRDTMGQAAGLTGGYGNTYSQNAGQQQYNAYLQRLNDNIPQLYAQAMNRYQMEGQQLQDQYNMYQNADATDYSRWGDQYNQWVNERANAQNEYNTLLGQEQADFQYDNNMNYQLWKDNQQMAQLEMEWYLQNGVRPPESIYQAAGYSDDYINAVFPEGGSGGGEAWDGIYRDWTGMPVNNNAASGSNTGSGRNTETADAQALRQAARDLSGGDPQLREAVTQALRQLKRT